MNCNTAILAPISESLTTYRDLKIGDVIECFTTTKYNTGSGSGLKRYYVLERRISGDLVELKLHPASTQRRIKDLLSAKFRADAPVEVLGKFDAQTHDERAMNAVLSALQPDMEPRTAWEIHALLQQQGMAIASIKIKAACRELKRAGQLIERKRNRRVLFRLPLPKESIPVVEFYGMPSEKLGWIEDWKPNRQTGKLHPIIRYLNGSTSFSAEERLDPVEDKISVRWINQIRSGTVPEPPTPIPNGLIRQLDARRMSHHSPSGLAMAAIAHYLGISESASKTTRQSREEVAIYLNTYYPGWNYGFDYHSQFQPLRGVA